MEAESRNRELVPKNLYLQFSVQFAVQEYPLAPEILDFFYDYQKTFEQYCNV